MASASSLIRYIPAARMYVSEPSPSMFGNPSNESSNPKWTNKNWLKSRFHFSFAEYNSYKNSQFGVLRVLNDDLVQPLRGFGSHPHRGMEICTYIVNGFITHKDSTGTNETLSRGGLQYMSAGDGVVHSEHNLHAESPLRFIQMWILPRSRGGSPIYGGVETKREQRLNKFFHLVSDRRNSAIETPAKVNQDANIYIAELDSGAEASLPIHPGRQAYFVCLEGTAELKGDGQPSQKLTNGDAAEIIGQVSLSARAPEGSSAHVLVVEMAYDPQNCGRTDF